MSWQSQGGMYFKMVWWKPWWKQRCKFIALQYILLHLGSTSDTNRKPLTNLPSTPKLKQAKEENNHIRSIANEQRFNLRLQHQIQSLPFVGLRSWKPLLKLRASKEEDSMVNCKHSYRVMRVQLSAETVYTFHSFKVKLLLS